MTTTIRDRVYRALRMLGVSDPEETPSAAQAQYGLLAANEMARAWKGKGVDIGHNADWTLDSILDAELPREHHEAFTALLAITLMPEYPGTVLPAATGAIAMDGWNSLQAAYMDTSEDSDLQAPTALRRNAANRWAGGIIR